jgi:DNA-binding helix-hairpin-helix protein with protein kinase domain
LIACGIVDASDVHPWLAIKGFGPMLKANLLAWRQWVEQSFVFRPNEPPDPADVRGVEQQIEQKKTELVQALSNGPTCSSSFFTCGRQSV